MNVLDGADAEPVAPAASKHAAVVVTAEMPIHRKLKPMIPPLLELTRVITTVFRLRRNRATRSRTMHEIAAETV